MTLKDQLEQRKKDLAGNKDKEGHLIEVEAQRMMLIDLQAAADVARVVAETAAVETVQEPSIDDVLAISALYQQYIGPAYRALVMRGEVEAPPVPTTPSEVVRGKNEFTS